MAGTLRDYVEKRSEKGTYPVMLIKVRDGNDETVHYFGDLDEVEQFKDQNADLFGDGEAREKAEKNRAQTRRATEADLHLESKAIADLLGKLSKKGLDVDHYSAQDKPLFELIEGEGERRPSRRCFRFPRF